MESAFNMAIFFVFAWVVLELSYIDHLTYRLPDQLTISLLIAGILLNIGHYFVPLKDSFTAAVVSYVACRIYHDCQINRRGFAGIGLGDAKYIAALGAWFGTSGLAMVLVGASIWTLIFYWKRTEMPFGVGLSISGICMWFYLTVELG